MNASQRLFDRFEKAGPSWLPIIVLSIVGLVSTILCIRAVDGLAEGRLSNAIEAIYLRSRELGQQDTLLFAVTKFHADALSDLAKQRLEQAKSIAPDLEFLEVLNGDPAFPTNLQSDTNEAELKNSLLYIWCDEDRQSILIGQIKSEFTVNQLSLLKDSGIKPWLSAAMVFSKFASPEVHYESTIAIGGEMEIEATETTFALDLMSPDSIKTLMRRHDEATAGMMLEELDVGSIEVVIQDYLNHRAFNLAKQGGYSNEKVKRLHGAGLEEISEEWRNTFLFALYLGHRNGRSKQFDQFVLEKMSRDREVIPDQESDPSRIILHPLSCPIRTAALLAGEGLEEVTHTDSEGLTRSVPKADFPVDLIKRIEAFAQQSPDLQTLMDSLQEQIENRTEYKPIYQMEKPFPATVYQIQSSI